MPIYVHCPRIVGTINTTGVTYYLSQQDAITLTLATADCYLTISAIVAPVIQPLACDKATATASFMA